jgi:hypothetical protein
VADEKADPNLSYEEILDAIEEDLTEVATLATKGKPGKTQATPAKLTPSAKNAAGPQATPGTARNQPPPTLTASAASERAIDLDEDVDILTLSPEDVMARTLAEVDRVKNGARKTIGQAARAQG